MPGTQKKFHTAAGYLKYKAEIPGSPEICLKPTRLTLNTRQFKKGTPKENCRL